MSSRPSGEHAYRDAMMSSSPSSHELSRTIALWRRCSKTMINYQRLLQVPGIGPILASAAIASIGNGAQFSSARQMAAWLGLTPRGESSGDRLHMKGISKRGNRYLRTLFIYGARAVVNWCQHKTDPLNLWIQRLIARRGRHKTIVAVAHKLARFAWVILNRKVDYRAPQAIAAYA